MIEFGRGEGLAGLLDMIVDGIVAPPYTLPTFAVRVYGWDGAFNWAVIDRSGRLGFPKARLGDLHGQASFEGEIQNAAFPIPSDPKYATGTFTFTNNQSQNAMSVPVRISGLSISKMDPRKKNSTDIWQISGKAVIDGPLSIMWNGSQAVIESATLNFAETAVGMSKVYDPNGLLVSATQRIDVEGVANNDTSEAAMLVLQIATATAPWISLKPVQAEFHRTDKAGGYYSVAWGLRDSKDEHELPANITHLDPLNLTSTASRGLVNGTTSTLTGFALRSTSVNQLTNGTVASLNSYFTTTEFGLRNTVEDHTFPGTFFENDTNGLFTKGEVTFVGANSAPTFSMPAGFPSTLKVVSAKTVRLTSSLGTNNQYETVWNLGLKDTTEEILFPQVKSIRTSNQAVDYSPAIYSVTTAPWYAVASGLWKQYQGSVSSAGGYLNKITVGAIVDGKMLANFEYSNPGVRVKGKSQSGAAMLECIMNGTNPQLYVESNLAYGFAKNGTTSNSRRMLVLSRQRSHSVIVRDFTIFRMVPATAIPDANPVQINGVTLPTPGHINGATFLGLPALTVKYAYADYDVNTTFFVDGVLNVMMGYRFHYVSTGIIDYVPQSIYLRRFAQQVSTTATGWVNAADIGVREIVQPATDSFLAFLA